MDGGRDQSVRVGTPMKCRPASNPYTAWLLWGGLALSSAGIAGAQPAAQPVAAGPGNAAPAAAAPGAATPGPLAYRSPGQGQSVAPLEPPPAAGRQAAGQDPNP